jgi:hypothetical protein
MAMAMIALGQWLQRHSHDLYQVRMRLWVINNRSGVFEEGIWRSKSP